MKKIALGIGIITVISAGVNVQAAVMPSFTDATSNAGISMLNGVVNTMSGGIAWIDYDNDGLQDLFVANEAGSNQLFHNVGRGQFTQIVAADAGFQLPGIKSLGVAVGDYDGDGYDDIFIAACGENVLLRNVIGTGKFTNVTGPANLFNKNKRSFGAAFSDIDMDGDLDLYVSTWTGAPASANDLYINRGDGSFEKASDSIGVDDNGSAFVSIFTDYDNDRDLDLLVINDVLFWVPDELYQNEGVNLSGEPVFTRVAASVGLAQTFAGMGITVGDYNNDGFLDYYQSHFNDGTLSSNQGGFSFQNINLPGNGKTGWGAVFFDANNDGFLDLYRGNSGSGFGTGLQENDFWLNDGQGKFRLSTAAAGLDQNAKSAYYAGLGMATADYDGDGDIDVVSHDLHGEIDLARNNTVTNNNWLRINLRGDFPNHRAIGAKIRVTSNKAGVFMNQVREIHAGDSHGSTSEFSAHFGFPAGSTLTGLTVEWPDRTDTVVSSVALNTSLEVFQSNPPQQPPQADALDPVTRRVVNILPAILRPLL